MSDYDVIVIGGGSPGEHCAGALAEGGLRVALVERELVGGECSYWACVPSKTLLRPGEAAHAANDAAARAEVDAAAALAWRDFMVSNYSGAAQERWLAEHGIDLKRGHGRLGGEPELVWSADWLKRASAPVPTAENALALSYADSEASRAAGMASLGRAPHRPAAYVSPTSMATQAEVIRRFADGDDGGWYARLKAMTAPAFVANGDRDGLFPAIDSAVLAREIPRSQLAIYPDSGHAFLFQYPERFADDVARFLGTG